MSILENLEDLQYGRFYGHFPRFGLGLLADVHWRQALLCGLALGLLIKLFMVLRDVRAFCRSVRNIPTYREDNFISGSIPLSVLIYIWSERFRQIQYEVMQGAYSATFLMKERLFKGWLGWQPFIYIHKPETMEQVLMISSDAVINKAVQYSFATPWLGEGMLLSGSSKWRQRRKMVSNVFHFSIIHDFVPSINRNSQQFVKRLAALEDGLCNNLSYFTTRCALDIICHTVMGFKLDSLINGNCDYCDLVQDLTETLMERMLRPLIILDKMFSLTKDGRRFSENVLKVHRFTLKIIEERKRQIISQRQSGKDSGQDGHKDSGVESDSENIYLKKKDRKPLLDLLLDIHLNDPKVFTIDDIREEVDNFMFAGHDTTATAMNFSIYLLGLYPQIQERAREEVDEMFDQWPDASETGLTLEMIRDLKYVECCIKESLRLYPSVPLIAREVTSPIKIDGKTIPQGCVLLLWFYALHRDPEQWPKPEIFDPDRFSPENSANRHPFAFVPFSAGSRNCIGQKFAMAEMKITMATLLRNLRWKSLDHRDKITVDHELILRARNPLRVKFSCRTEIE